MSNKIISESFGNDQGERLRYIRKELGLTPEQAAIRANVSAQQWRKYERGEAEPKVSKMIFLLQEGISLNWIMNGEGPKRLGEEISPPSQDGQNHKEVEKEEKREVERRCQERRIKDLISPNLKEGVEALRSLEKNHPKSFFIMLGKILEEVRNQENQPEEIEKKNAANH